MGVTGLWQVIQPCARPTNLATLNRKRLAVDASIWIYQFLKAMRDNDGNAMPYSHVVGFFRRICKLLFYGVQPVFVFDGGAPVLKRLTIQSRRKRREGRRDDAARTAGKLLAVQMQRLAEEEEDRRKKTTNSTGTEDLFGDDVQGVGGPEAPLPDANELVYVDEIGMGQRERMQNRRFQKQDAYHLPELPGGIESMAKPEDPRIMSVEELEDYARQFQSGEDVNLYDFSKIDFDGDFFNSLPAVDRYNILNAGRLRSRLRMGVSAEQLKDMFPDRMAFSRFQIERVKERNRLTQRLMYEVGMTGTDLTLGAKGGGLNARVVGEKDREYILVKNESAVGGWALGVVSKDRAGTSDKPIDVEALDAKPQEEDSDEDLEFEDVPVEGLNRLPKPQAGRTADDYMSQQAKIMGASIHELYGIVNEDEDSLFVEDNTHPVDRNLNNTQSDGDALFADEDEDLSRAIAMSLETHHGVSNHQPESSEADPLAGPSNWAQRAADIPKPIQSTASSGSMLAHIINNRANAAARGAAAINASQDGGDSSDSDDDFSTALAAAAKKIGNKSKAVVRPGPLPFEAMEWGKSIFAVANEQQEPATDLGATAKQPPSRKGKERVTFEEVESDNEMSGGFFKAAVEKEQDITVASTAQASSSVNPDKPTPLPPWITDNADIRESLKNAKAGASRMTAQHDAYLTERAVLRQQKNREEAIEIESDKDDIDGEIVETSPLPPQPSPRPTKEVEETRRDVEALSVREQKEPVPEIPVEEDIVMVEEPVADKPADAVQLSSPSEEEDDFTFEDVAIPAADELQQPIERDESPDTFADIQPDVNPKPIPTNDDDEEDIFAGIEAPAIAPQEDSYTDPEDEELFVQMAEEAEAHAAFTTAFNYKPISTTSRAALDKTIATLQAEKDKQTRDSDEVTQVMITEVQSLLRLFGIPYITAPMEAEAQCAELVRLNLVDGIVTDDSDTFLFGGTRVYKNMFNGKKFVECYMAADLDNELSLSRTQLISLAQLLGSDYIEGLPGIGPVTAVELLAEFPGPDGLVGFRDWWAEVQKTGRLDDADKANKFRKKFRKAHGKKLFLPPVFPSTAVEEAYLAPNVDASGENFVWGVPDLEGLRRFLMGSVGWSPEETDEVLVPVIRDMNRRAVEGTQTNITRYFGAAPGNVNVVDEGAGGEAFAPRVRGKTSKRMSEAVGKLRARNEAGGGGGDGAQRAEDGEGSGSGTGTGRRKRKAGREAVVVLDDYEDGDGEYDGGREESSGENEEEGKSRTTRGKGKGKKRVKAS